MFKSIKFSKAFTLLAVPLLMYSTLVLLINSSLFSAHSSSLSSAITLDLLLTIPFVYFLLIRKTSIPKTTVVPLIMLGVITGTIILPLDHQHYLIFFKDWILPVLELTILAFVIYKLVKTIRLYKGHKISVSFDFFTALKATCYEILPKVFVIPVVTEIAVFYYGFIHWKKKKLKSNEFSYHKDSGSIGLFTTLIFLIAIETLAFHLVLARWNMTIAWIFSGISLYSGIQILGFTKSMLSRPHSIDNDRLYLRYGMMNETIIAMEDIVSIDLSTKELESNTHTRSLSALGSLEGHNVVIRLKKENTLVGLYGIERPFTTLGVHVDNKQDFKDEIDRVLNQNLKSN